MSSVVTLRVQNPCRTVKGSTVRATARRSMTVVSEASFARESDKSQTSRRFMLGALILGVTLSTKEAFADTCSLIKPCTPAAPDGKPRYNTPGPAYSPGKEAEARFLAKLQAEAAAKEKKEKIADSEQ
eukprot:CAMPEP_0118926480 /NCGR_PEP_ID=MMETSP1169-20130426/4153_1 /TAXON_ID=36882 /ORGANISM="Pyramimonas obovata, Strain CCMP722" /LENGTH=127 /DNA_ID=CAMNT_0006868035 /DNA_START=92 /DNA_END=475 /DNA_ORIENTATION=-